MTGEPIVKKLRWVGACAVSLALLVGCSDSGSKTSTSRKTTTAATQHAVGTTTETFVDRSRPTPPSGGKAKLPERTLKTVIFYPTAGSANTSATPKSDAKPDREGGPYPLIVFAHGLGASPAIYRDLLIPWAAAGYVVAAPYFPLSNGESAGGADGGDIESQPGDMSFVITKLLDASAKATGTFAGVIDAKAIGVAGHSEGALTTLGLVANTCCRDKRVRAAVVLAGNPLVFGGGTYDYEDAPPMLLVHGADDTYLPYGEAVNIFNDAVGPKGLLTVEKGGHGDWLASSATAFKSVLRTTLDFFAAYLEGDDGARDRIPADGTAGITKITFVRKAGDKTTIKTTPKPKADRHASVVPAANLANGQKVTVTWSGFTGKVVNVVQCAPGPVGSSAPCDIAHGQILHPSAGGVGSLQLEIVVGPVGTGICDAEHDGCFVAVNDGSSQDADATIRIPITIAP